MEGCGRSIRLAVLVAGTGRSRKRGSMKHDRACPADLLLYLGLTGVFHLQ